MSTSGSKFRASKLAPWEQEAARNLRTLFDKHTELTQKAFGARYDIGSPSMMSQYLGGQRPLGLEAALKFASGLGIDVREISPHFRTKLEPHQSILPEALANRLASADDATRRLIEIALLENDEEAVHSLTPSLVSLVRTMKAILREQQQADAP